MVCVGVLSSFSHVQLFATPWTAACQSPLSMGFSRQPYWSGLPCPPPGDLQTQGSNLCLSCLLHWQAGSLPLSERGSEVAQLCPTLCDPMDGGYQAPPSMGFSRQEFWSGLPFPSPGDLPDSGIKPRSPALQADALPSEPPGNASLPLAPPR